MAAALATWAQHLLRRSGQPSRPSGPAGHRLVGVPASVTRVLAVRPGTVAVLLEPGRSPQVKGPGGVLVPPLLAPSRRPVVLPVCTVPVDLTASVHGCVTFDGYALEPVTVRFGVELDPGDGYAGLLALVTQHGTGIEAALLAAIHQEVARAVVGATGVNRLADLQRSSLAEVLRGRWWPAAFAGGVLRSVHLDVAQVSWPEGAGGPGRDELDPSEQSRPGWPPLTSDPSTLDQPGGTGWSGDPIGAGAVPAGTVPAGPVPAETSPVGAVPVGNVPVGTVPVVAVPAATIPVAVPVGAGPQPGEAVGEAARTFRDERYDDGEPTVPLPRVVL